MNIVSVLIVVGMAVVLLLIVGVVGALRVRSSAPAPLTSLTDAASVELEDRLRRLTQRQVSATEEPALRGGVAATRGAAVREDQPGGARRSMADRLADKQRATSLRPVEQAAPSTRLALPGSGTVRMSESTAHASNNGEGLNPLAARFTSVDDQPGSPGPSTVRLESPGVTTNARGTGRIGTDVGPLPRSGDGPARRQRPELPGQAAGGLNQQPIARSQTRALPPERLESAHAAVSSTGDAPAQRPATQPIGALPPTQRMTLPPPEAPAPPVTPRPELYGFAASSEAAALDIRAILRGDALPQPVAPLTKAPTAKFVTGPLSPLVERGAPLGAVPFDPNLLRVTELPAAMRPEAPIGPAQYGGADAERVAAPASALDFDATRIMDDFDLPDAGFETHVFSTSELIESESLGFPSFTPPITADEQRTIKDASFGMSSTPEAQAFASLEAALPPLGAPLSAPPSAGTRLRLDQMDRLQPVLDELAGCADVQAVVLLAKDGEPLASAGKQPVDVVRASHALVELARSAIMEAQQLDLGACSAFVVEAPAAALLLSPLPGGACLVVLLSNPARLGLLRRQVRAALGSVRSVVSESSVS